MQYNGSIFKNRKFDFKKLKKFGFKTFDNEYIYKTLISDDDFELTVKINFDEVLNVNLVEKSTGEDYNLIFIKNAEGEFVGKVREEFEKVLIEIRDECTFFTAFKTKQANLVIEYVKEKYGSRAEFLWDKFSDTCIFRKNVESKNGGKWYAVLLTVAKHKIGLKGNEITEIIDLKAKPETVENIVDNKKYFHGYHMNKKHWITICLNGTGENYVDFEEIKQRIDESYKII